MTTLVFALGWRPTWIGQLRLVVLVAAVTAAFLLLGEFLIVVCRLPAMLVQAASWAAWLFWLGSVFPRHYAQRRYALSSLPYRSAFLCEILPGIGCSFALLLRPALDGSLHATSPDSRILIAPGVLLLACGGALIVMGARTLGLARTLFVHEYLPVGNSHSDITTEGIYSYIRHPLFLGGIAVSMGLAACVGTRHAILLAGLNVCFLPAYVLLEDRRCGAVVGREYLCYRQTVGAVIPKLGRLAAALSSRREGLSRIRSDALRSARQKPGRHPGV
jgi:protein-S-isoprenylcysteine O-methyltransferase Ste14